MSGISLTSGLYSTADLFQTTQPTGSSFFSNFQDLTSALQSGDLAQAQQAYNALTQNAPGAMANSPIATAMNNLGAALQSGNLQGAQQALSQVQQAMQQGMEAGGHHHHHHGGGGQVQSSSSSIGATNDPTSLFNPANSVLSPSSSDSSTNSGNNGNNNLLNIVG